MKIRKNGKVIRLTESDLRKITKRVISEQKNINEIMFNDTNYDDMNYKRPNRKERKLVSQFKYEILNKLETGGSDWAINVSNPSLTNLIDGIRKVCDKYENRM